MKSTTKSSKRAILIRDPSIAKATLREENENPSFYTFLLIIFGFFKNIYTFAAKLDAKYSNIRFKTCWKDVYERSLLVSNFATSAQEDTAA